MEQDLNEQINNNALEFKCNDFSGIELGHTFSDGKEYDEAGNLIGPITTKVATTVDQYMAMERRMELLKQSVAFESDRPKPVLWDKFNMIVFPEAKWQVKNLIPNEGFVIIASPSGEKKTWIALAMAKAIANGHDFLGNPDFATMAGNVLYLDQEMSKSELQRRGRQLKLSGNKMRLWLLSQDGLNLNSADIATWLMELVDMHDIKAVFVDTFRAMAGGMKEEKAEEIRAFFNLYKPLKDKGVVMIFLDHCRKPAHLEGRTPKKEQLFASQDKVGNAEVLMMLRSDAGGKEIFIHQVKNRLGQELPPFKVLMDDQVDQDGSKTTTLIYGGEFEEKELKIETAKELILASLKEEGKTTSELKEAGKQNKVGDRNVLEAIRQLQTEGKIVLGAKKGRQYFYELPKTEDSLSDQDQQNLEAVGLI